MALIDEWMPVYDRSSRHSTQIAASIRDVWRALLATDFTDHPVVRSLLGLRALPTFLLHPRKALARSIRPRERPAVGIDAILRTEFVLLQKRAPTDLVLGVTGRFWSLTGNLTTSDLAAFRDPVPEGLARACWAFELTGRDGATRLATETRILCAGRRERRAFGMYWTMIRPFSGMIRTLILGQVAREVRRAGAGVRTE